jgi:hypothetical protein
MRFALIAVLASACNGDPGGVKPTSPSSDIAFYRNGGGCYPTGTMSQIQDMVVLVNPEWVPVHNGQVVDSEPVLVHGIAHNPHGDTGGDAPMTHISSDMNATLELDAEDAWRAASGNVADEDGFLELEWESKSVPDWAWPGEGDRVAALGRWIFDCGHPGEVPGHCVAAPQSACIVDNDCAVGDTCIDQHFRYQSELHPPYAMAVMREGRGAMINGTAALATRTDVFVSPNGGAAGDECLLTHEPRVTDVIFSRQCYPLSKPIAKLHSRDFEFDVPLPARPAGAHAVWQVMDRPPDGGVAAQISVVTLEEVPNPHLSVTVKLTDPAVTGYAATIFAGWQATAPALTHVRVTVSGVVVTNALKPAMPVSRPAPGWRLQIAANGEWQRVGGLEDIMAPQTVQESVVLDQWLPQGAPLHLFVNGTSASCIDTMFGKDIMTDIAELGDLTAFGNCLLSVNADPGVVDVTYEGPDYGAGMHETAATHSQGGVCGNSQTPCMSSGDCTGGQNCNPTGTAYTLQYKIEVVP